MMWEVSDPWCRMISPFMEDLAKEYKGKPTVIVASSIKGKGVSFMENNPKFHGVAPTPAEVEQALKELQ